MYNTTVIIIILLLCKDFITNTGLRTKHDVKLILSAGHTVF